MFCTDKPRAQIRKVKPEVSGLSPIPNGNDTAAHWNTGWGRAEAQAIKREEKRKAAA